MGALLDTLGAMLEEDGWKLLHIPGRAALGSVARGRNGSWSCLGVELEEQQRLLFYSTYPVAIPAERRAAVTELITRLNYGTALGNFEMDLDDGEVRFRTSIEVREGPISRALLTPIVYENVATTDRYLPAFEHVVAGSASPIDAIAAAEDEPSP